MQVTQNEPGFSQPLNVVGRTWLMTFDSDEPFVADVQMLVRGRWHDVYDRGVKVTIDSSNGPTYCHLHAGLSYRMNVRECTAPVTMAGSELSAYSVLA